MYLATFNLKGFMEVINNGKLYTSKYRVNQIYLIHNPPPNYWNIFDLKLFYVKKNSL
jgi:hypothetical protein